MSSTKTAEIMGKSRAAIQAAYRARKKKQLGEKEFLKQESDRVQKYYVPVNKLSRKEKKERREEVNSRVRRHRGKKKKILQGASPGHPPIPKKPALTPKPSVNKLSQKKNGTPTNGKSPVPKPKPRAPPRINGGTSVASPQPTTNGTNGESKAEKDQVVEDASNAPGNVTTSETNGESAIVDPPVEEKITESSNEESNVRLQKGGEPEKELNGECASQMAEEKAVEKPPVSEESSNAAEEIKKPPSSDKPPVKKPPPPKPRTPNPRRSLSVMDAGSKTPTKPAVKLTKSHSVLVNGEHSSDHSLSPVTEEDAPPIIPARKKRLSRDSSKVKFDKPESNLKLNSERIEETTSTSTPALPSPSQSTPFILVASPTAVKPPAITPVRPPLPSRRAPLKDCVSEKVDEESPPPSSVPCRTDTNGNPAVSNRTRAKSEYMKNKPARPPPPAIKPSLSVSLPSTASPPPKHPKPTVRKTKSQFIPKESPLGFTTIDINADDDKSSQESDSPRIPPRKKHSKLVEKPKPATVAETEQSNSNPENFVLKQTIYDSQTDTVTQVDLPIMPIVPCKTTSQSPSPSNESETNSQEPSVARKSMPLPTSKKPPPKLTHSLTEPERSNPLILGRRPKIGSPRKAPLAPPIPVKPLQTVTDNAKNDEKDSSKSTPVIPSETPPLSPKSFSVKSHHSSPKHRPRLPPPPPPPVESITDLPERRNITSRSKSLDTTITSDPNGNLARTPKNTVENENAKNSSKLANHDIFCNRDSQDSVQSTSDYKSMSSVSRNSVMSEADDDYVLPDPQSPQSPPLSPRKPPKPEEQIYTNKQVASVRPSRRVAPPRPVKPDFSRKTSLPASPAVSPPTSPTGTCPVSPSAFSKTPGSGKLKKKAPAKPVRRSLSINSDVSNDGYEDMSKGSSLASSLGIGSEVTDLYSVPRTCEHTQHESGRCSCAQQYADQSSGEEDDGSISDEDEEGDKFIEHSDVNEDQSDGNNVNPNKAFLVAKEIRDSEKVFVDVLKLLNKDFRQAIDDAGTREGRPVIEQFFLHQVLGHLPQLQMFNEELLQDLEDAVNNWVDSPSISSIFLKKGPYLKLYSSYIRDFEKITTVFDEACGRFPLFGAAVRDFELSERCQNLAIKHYMLKPIQRIPQYKLLLTDYLKQLEEGTKEHAETASALNIVSEVANHANECMRQGDNFGKLLQIQHSLIGNHEIVKPGRVFIKEGELLKLSRKVMQPRKFYLMNDILLYTTPFPPGQYKLNNVLSLAGMRINKPQLEDFKNEFNIISVQRSFTLSANTPEERDEWIEALTKTIADYATKRSSFSVLQPSLVEGDTSSLGHKAPIWIPDSRVTMCMICTCEFTITWRRHHCRACGKVVCGNCSMNKVPLMYLSSKTARVCEECFNCLAKEECEEEEGNNKERKFKSKRKRSLKETKRPAALKEVSANESDTNMSGYLHVKRKNWKRMWFVLKGKVLYTYKASEDVAALESMPLLGYEIKILEEYYEGIEPGLVIQLYHQERVMSVFRTESKAATDKWAYAMIDATVL